MLSCGDDTPVQLVMQQLGAQVLCMGGSPHLAGLDLLRAVLGNVGADILEVHIERVASGHQVIVVHCLNEGLHTLADQKQIGGVDGRMAQCAAA